MESTVDGSGRVFPIVQGAEIHTTGLTKRELFAAMALQGMLSHATRYEPRQGASTNWHEAISEEAVQIADALINELNKQNETD